MWPNIETRPMSVPTMPRPGAASPNALKILWPSSSALVVEIALALERGAERLGGEAVGDHAHAALEERVVDLDLLERDRPLAAHGLGDLGDLVDQLGRRDVLVEDGALDAERRARRRSCPACSDA